MPPYVIANQHIFGCAIKRNTRTKVWRRVMLDNGRRYVRYKLCTEVCDDVVVTFGCAWPGGWVVGWVSKPIRGKHAGLFCPEGWHACPRIRIGSCWKA